MPRYPPLIKPFLVCHYSC